MRLPRPTDGELDILNIIWDAGPLTVRKVHERLAETKRSQYTTTLKLMQIMAVKGLVKRDESERSHVYRAALQRDEARKHFARQMLNRVFGGSAREFLLGALGAKKISAKELAEIRRVLDDYEKGLKR